MSSNLASPKDLLRTNHGKLIVVSGPSGAGKSTVVRCLLENCPLPLELSVSATTRPAREGEKDGREYYFLSHAEFEKRRERGDFLECKEVFGRGHWYGTLRDVVSAGLSNGKWVILEIDVEGAISVFEQIPDVISLFVDPGTIEELEKRLRARGTETEEAIQRRLEVAKAELAKSHLYTYRVVNDTVDHCVQTICKLLSEHQGISRVCSKN